MRPGIFFLIIILLGSCSHKTIYPNLKKWWMPDGESHLKGKVKRVELIINDSVRSPFFVDFDGQGNIVASTLETGFTRDGIMSPYLKRYTYYPDGHLKTVASINPATQEVQATDSFANVGSRKFKTITTTNSTSTLWDTPTFTDAVKDSTSQHFVSYYDPAGFLIKTEHYVITYKKHQLVADELWSYTEIINNNQGYPVKIIKWHTNDKKPWQETNIFYSGRELPDSTSWTDNSGSIHHEANLFNNQGDIIEKRIKRGNYIMYSLDTIKFRYTYDVAGNWTEMERYNKAGEVIKKEKRLITYW